MKHQLTRTSSKMLSCCCGGDNDHFYKEVDSFRLLKCGTCQTIRLESIHIDPMNFLDEAEVEEGLEYWGYPDFYKKHETVFNHFFQERFERIMGEYPKKGEWLDVGSGYGLWQMFLKTKKQSSHGLEIEKKAVQFALREGVSIEHVSIESFQAAKKYSVITMCDVLEHVEGPQDVLQKCYSMLEPGGLLYIQVPNVLGLKYPYGDSLGLPHHLWQFDPATLISLLKKEQFSLCDYWTGVQGIIKHYETGGPSVYYRFMWGLAKTFKRGNRLQVLVKK